MSPSSSIMHKRNARRITGSFFELDGSLGYNKQDTNLTVTKSGILMNVNNQKLCKSMSNLTFKSNQGTPILY